jgi:CrcB protein
MHVYEYGLIAIGSALGGMGRFWLATLVGRLAGGAFPWGTVLVNVSGCLAIGAIFTVTGPAGRYSIAGEWRQFLMIGICGGYTTFSSFALQTLLLAQEGEILAAALNVLSSVVLCLAAVWIGHIFALQINGLRGMG